MNNLERLVNQLVRVGTVTSIYPDSPTARVTFDDQDDITSYDLQIIVRNSGKNKDYWTPDVDEQVLCLFLPVGIEQGFILGSYYDSTNPPPANSSDIRTTIFSNGTTIKNDRVGNKLSIAAVGDVEITATGNITMKADGEIVYQSKKNTSDAPETIITEKGTVKGLLSFKAGMNGKGGEGNTAEIEGSVNVINGEVTVDGIGSKSHHHTAQGENADTTEAKP